MLDKCNIFWNKDVDIENLQMYTNKYKDYEKESMSEIVYRDS